MSSSTSSLSILVQEYLNTHTTASLSSPCDVFGPLLLNVLNKHLKDEYEILPLWIVKCEPKRLIFNALYEGRIVFAKAIQDERIQTSDVLYSVLPPLFPTPRVLFEFTLFDLNVIVTEYVSDAIELCDFSDPIPDAIISGLFSLISVIRSIKVPYDSCSALPPFYSSRLSLKYSPDTIRDFLRAFLPPDFSLPYFQLDSKWTLCHCDLFFRNILVSKDLTSVKALIDWEYASVLPDFAEFFQYFYTLQEYGFTFDSDITSFLSLFYTQSVKQVSSIFHFAELNYQAELEATSPNQCPYSPISLEEAQERYSLITSIESSIKHQTSASSSNTETETSKPFPTSTHEPNKPQSPPLGMLFHSPSLISTLKVPNKPPPSAFQS